MYIFASNIVIMKKANIITFVFLLFILQGFSQENGKYFVKFTQNQEIEIEINLSEFGSVYQMSKVFQTSIEHILSYNEIKDVGTLQPNQIIKIRVDKNKVSNQKSTNALALYYKVQEGETLYRIARTYMNQDINQFIDRNKLIDHNLKKDAVLFLGYLNSNTSNNSVLAQKPVVEETLLDSTRTDLITIPEITYVKQKGIAFVQDRKSKNEGYYVLHSDAKVNSEIEIYNPMARRTVKAKVLAKIPEGTYNSDINVVLSNATAKSLGALDARFMVEIKYIP